MYTLYVEAAGHTGIRVVWPATTVYYPLKWFGVEHIIEDQLRIIARHSQLFLIPFFEPKTGPTDWYHLLSPRSFDLATYITEMGGANLSSWVNSLAVYPPPSLPSTRDWIVQMHMHFSSSHIFYVCSPLQLHRSRSFAVSLESIEPKLTVIRLTRCLRCLDPKQGAYRLLFVFHLSIAEWRVCSITDMNLLSTAMGNKPGYTMLFSERRNLDKFGLNAYLKTYSTSQTLQCWPSWPPTWTQFPEPFLAGVCPYYDCRSSYLSSLHLFFCSGF